MTTTNGNHSRPTKVFQFMTLRVSSEAIRALLTTPLGFTVVGQADSMTVGMPLIKEARPDVIISGIRPGSFTPSAIIAELRAMGMCIPVVVLTTHADPVYIQEAIRAAVHGYLLIGETTTEQLALAIQGAREGLAVFGPTVHRLVAEAGPQLAGPAPVEGLTDREQQVLDLMVKGMGNREIAAQLSVSLRTVQLHTSHLLTKLGAHSRLELAVRSLQSRRPIAG